MSTSPQTKDTTALGTAWRTLLRGYNALVPPPGPITDGPQGLNPWRKFDPNEGTGWDIRENQERLREAGMILARASDLNPADKARIMELLGVEES